jgi:hypothetical protein
MVNDAASATLPSFTINDYLFLVTDSPYAPGNNPLIPRNGGAGGNSFDLGDVGDEAANITQI